ncbi:hypothetical protein JXA12_04370 [Candidatus Woesearchaeota archaeon]|nr:hypothetical protein [Candidatus Woesearchaeota archaeon]
MGRGRGIFGMSIASQRAWQNTISFIFIIVGIYLVLAWLEITPFTARFEFLNNKANLILTAIILIVIGVLLSEKIKSLFS